MSTISERGDTTAADPTAAENPSHAGTSSPNRATEEEILQRARKFEEILEDLVRNEGGEDEQRLVRRFSVTLRRFHVSAWRAVARGQLGTPRLIFDQLQKFGGVADRLAPPTTPAQRAGLFLRSTLEFFSLADQSLAAVRTEVRISDKERSATERAILRVLAESPTAYLRRGQVHELLDPETRPGSARVGQVLAQLTEENLLLQVFAPAQGNPQTAHYRLSPLGHELWSKFQSHKPAIDSAKTPRNVDVPEVAENADWTAPRYLTQFKLLVANAVDKDLPVECRRITAGMLESAADQMPENLKCQVRSWIRQQAPQEDDDDRQALESIFAERPSAHDNESRRPKPLGTRTTKSLARRDARDRPEL